jgi:CheY-like chemotaxis protein
VVRGVGKMLDRVVREDIVISFRLSDDIGLIRADVSQVEQILMNLAVNARDAMSSGGTLSISTESRELAGDVAMESGPVPAGRYAVLSVADTGCGMDRETRAQMFEPFFTTKAGGGGTGLGLSTVYGIAKRHGAGIEVESEVGRGTTFRVHFPEVQGARDYEAPAQPATEENFRGTETVLVVEDDSNVRTLASEALKRFGYNVIDFEDPTRALSFMKRTNQPVHLLLTDIVMPRMNGRELSMRLQTLAPSLKVLYMSGYAGSTISKYGVFDGEAHFMRKPFTLQTLVREVRHTLDGQ